jgi:hypothetical protein
MGCMLNSHRFCLAVRMGSARACSPRRGAVRDQPTVDEITPFANIKTFGVSERYDRNWSATAQLPAVRCITSKAGDLGSAAMARMARFRRV